MADKIQLEVVTPEKMVVSEPVDIVVATGVEGEFGILPGHIPFLTPLRIGELRYRSGSKTEYMAVMGGFAEVSHNKVTILAESAEKVRDIDLERARKAKERAEQRLTEAQAKKEGVDYARAEAALKRSILRLKMIEKEK
jgi:F-type H+-transporting ATPase subunit epsilon